MYPVWPKGSRSASGMDCLADDSRCDLRSSTSAEDNGSISMMVPAQINSALCQPIWLINAWPYGNIRNCPNDPAELAMPSATVRRCGGEGRPTTPNTMLNPQQGRGTPRISADDKKNSHSLSASST